MTFQPNLYDKDKSFREYHEANPQVFEMFCRFTFELIRAGRKRVGAKMIAERLRWESNVRGNDGFKINNTYVAGYSRLFEKRYPQHEGLFSKRAARADVEGV